MHRYYFEIYAKFSVDIMYPGPLSIHPAIISPVFYFDGITHT